MKREKEKEKGEVNRGGDSYARVQYEYSRFLGRKVLCASCAIYHIDPSEYFNAVELGGKYRSRAFK